jgi:hypothetical protein
MSERPDRRAATQAGRGLVIIRLRGLTMTALKIT